MARRYRNRSVEVNGLGSALTSLETLREGYSTNAKWIVGVGAEYGVYLEFGTSKMRAYPFLFPAARHVMRTKFESLERASRASSDPISFLVESLAREIEGQAKKNATAARSSGRSPGTEKDHPQRQTGNLVGSIEAAPAGAF